MVKAPVPGLAEKARKTVVLKKEFTSFVATWVHVILAPESVGRVAPAAFRFTTVARTRRLAPGAIEAVVYDAASVPSAPVVKCVAVTGILNYILALTLKVPLSIYRSVSKPVVVPGRSGSKGGSSYV